MLNILNNDNNNKKIVLQKNDRHYVRTSYSNPKTFDFLNIIQMQAELFFLKSNLLFSIVLHIKYYVFDDTCKLQYLE